MAEVKCVEPAMMSSEAGSHYVCLVKKEDTLLFPHVDVCMAAAWITTSSWQMIGGHVPGKWDETSDDDLNGCAQRVFMEMDKRWSERTVDIVVTLGDPTDLTPAWTNIVKTMVRNLGARRYLMLWKDVPGGADLKIDGPSKRLVVTSTRTRQVLLDRTLDSIATEEVPVVYRLPVLFRVAEDLKNHFKAEPFKGSGSFHEDCPVEEQTRITNLFKEIFRVHGPCTEVQAPLNSSLSGDAAFRFRDGEKVIMKVTLAQHKRFGDRFPVRNITSAFRQYGQPA